MRMRPEQVPRQMPQPVPQSARQPGQRTESWLMLIVAMAALVLPVAVGAPGARLLLLHRHQNAGELSGSDTVLAGVPGPGRIAGTRRQGHGPLSGGATARCTTHRHPTTRCTPQ